MGKPNPKQGRLICRDILVAHNLQTLILVQMRVDWTVFVAELLHKVRFSDLGMFFAVF